MLAQEVSVQHYWAVDESSLPQITISRVMKSPRLVRGLIQLVRKLVDYTRFQRLLLNLLNPFIGPLSDPVVHIEVVSGHSLCGGVGDRVDLRFIVANHSKVMRLMAQYGCHECGEILNASFREGKDG